MDKQRELDLRIKIETARQIEEKANYPDEKIFAAYLLSRLKFKLNREKYPQAKEL